MLYIFLVNTGQMMTLDMNLAVDTVENLKSVIFAQYQIPVNNQVLLVSGGESLNQGDRVCKYSSAGTDTSPIFLFSKNQVDMTIPSSSEAEGDDDMKERVESCLQMEANFNTVVSRTEMAHQLYETDKMLYHSCDKLIHDQHLQQQGWAAVVANLEDIVTSFRNKHKRVEQLYQDILKNKHTFCQLLESFDQDKQILSRIPILNSLNPKNETQDGITLLDWILRKDSANSLDELYCMDELNNFDQEKLETLKSDIDEILKLCENTEMKEIKGLEQRLFALDKLMLEAKKVFDKQGILTKGFNQNQIRMSDLRDTSILPDLCQNHKEQLQGMLKNHLDLIDYKSRCLMAKKELSQNLYHRLRWIVHAEERLKEYDDILVVYGLKLKKLREKLDIVHNLHLAPQVYLNSIVEVLRRKSFSERFNHWSMIVSQTARQLIDSEVEHRQKFSTQLDKHFLKLFFPGMNDYPQNFISELVQVDKSLPQVSFDDLDYLKDQLPDMTSHLVVPSSVPIPFASPDEYVGRNQANTIEPFKDEKQKSYLLKSGAQIEYLDAGIETLLSAKDINQLESAKFDMEDCLSEKNQLIEDLVNKLNISETNRQKKEDLIQSCSTLNLKVLGLMKSLKVNVFSEINDQISNCSQNFNDCLTQVNCNLERLTERMHEERNDFELQIEQKNNYAAQLGEKILLIQNELNRKNAEYDKLCQMRDNEKKLILSQVCEMEKLKEEIDKLHQETDKKHSTINNLNEKLKSLKSKLEQSKQEVIVMLNNFVQVEMKLFADQFNENLNTLKKEYNANVKLIETKLSSEKDIDVQKLREQLSSEHKNELDSLRHRFKLAISTTSIERTSSETSLEKVQLDIVDQSAQEKEIQKMKTMLTDQKTEYEQSLLKLKNDYEAAIQAIKSELEREQKLNSEFGPDQVIQRMKLYETLFVRLNNRLNIDIENSDLSQCQEVLTTLLQEVNETTRNLDMFTRSFICLPSTSESPQQSKDIDSITSKYNKLKNLELLSPNNDDKISITSCEFGDNVLVYYEKKLENFIVFSLTSTLHYIHSDSLKECEFSKEPPLNELQWIIAKVMEKEYCQIRKEENRYKLPVNTKFYRVKIKQISKCNTTPLKLDQANVMNRSYMPSSSNRTILSNIMSFFGTSTESSSSIMSRSLDMPDT